MQIDKNAVVSMDYTLTDDQGTLIDSSKGNEPLSYVHGMGNIIPGLENALGGKKVGDSFTIAIPPDEGYGERNEALLQTVSKELFDKADTPQLGMQFQSSTEGQRTQLFTVVGIEENDIKIDGNHPLAGMTLNFDVTVVNIREASEEELSHGHVHDGHTHH